MFLVDPIWVWSIISDAIRLDSVAGVDISRLEMLKPSQLWQSCSFCRALNQAIQRCWSQASSQVRVKLGCFTLVPLPSCSMSIQPPQLQPSENVSRHISLTWPFLHRHQHTWWPFDVAVQLYRYCCQTLLRLLHHWGYWGCRNFDWLDTSVSTAIRNRQYRHTLYWNHDRNACIKSQISERTSANRLPLLVLIWISPVCKHCFGRAMYTCECVLSFASPWCLGANYIRTAW